jgi:hypothetical protein
VDFRADFRADRFVDFLLGRRAARPRRALFLARPPARLAPFRADFRAPFFAVFFALRLALFFALRFALRFALLLALLFAAFFAGRREDFLAAGRRSSDAGETGAKEVLVEGVAGVDAGVGAGVGAGSEGSGSIQPEPDQPISI